MINPPITHHLMALLGISAVALMACSTTTSNNNIQAVYQCERGSVLKVSFVDKSYSTLYGGKHSKKRHHLTASAIVNIDDHQLVTLTQERTASGFMYSNDRYSLRGKGKEAIWTVEKMVDEHCVADKN